MFRDEYEAGRDVSPTVGWTRACIGREDNGVLGRDIFDAVETIAGLSGIVDHAPVFSEVHVALAEMETRGTL
jgi:hypothetical protein